MMTVSGRTVRRLVLVFVLPLFCQIGSAQHTISDPLNPRTQADYVVIAPKEYVPVVEPLALYREDQSNYSVVIITTEAIYNIFGQGIPADSAIREFVTFSQTGWEDPKPQFYLLAGNVNGVPSHKEPGLEIIGEDSIMIDQWFVEGVPDSMGNTMLSAAIGRLPAWNALQLLVMIDKTIAYESMADSTWHSRSIIVADYSMDIGDAYEVQAQVVQESLAHVWSDTITVHIREDSPLHRSREQFRDIVNQGATLVTFAGYHEWYYFSESRYFTTWDVDSLSNGNRLPFWFFYSSQRFEKEDTLAMAVNLMQVEGRGAVGSIAPTGHTFLTDHFFFFRDLLEEMISNPNEPIGTMMLFVKRLGSTRGRRIIALLADPALVVKSSGVTGFDPDPPPVPTKTRLFQNYPNPFNPKTEIRFHLPAGQAGISDVRWVTLTIYDLLGREVATLVNERLMPGTYTRQWDATGQPSGVYFYRLSTDDFVQTRKLVLVR